MTEQQLSRANELRSKIARCKETIASLEGKATSVTINAGPLYKDQITMTLDEPFVAEFVKGVRLRLKEELKEMQDEFHRL